MIRDPPAWTARTPDTSPRRRRRPRAAAAVVQVHPVCRQARLQRRRAPHAARASCTRSENVVERHSWRGVKISLKCAKPVIGRRRTSGGSAGNLLIQSQAVPTAVDFRCRRMNICWRQVVPAPFALDHECEQTAPHASGLALSLDPLRGNRRSR